MLSLIVHILSIAYIDINSKIPLVWALQGNNSLKNIKSLSSLKLVFKDTPKLISLIAIAVFVYAIFNFLFFMFISNGTPSIKDGHYILQNHG